MININKVKKFNDFITNRKRSGRFNRIHIEGNLKGSFLVDLNHLK